MQKTSFGHLAKGIFFKGAKDADDQAGNNPYDVQHLQVLG